MPEVRNRSNNSASTCRRLHTKQSQAKKVREKQTDFTLRERLTVAPHLCQGVVLFAISKHVSHITNNGHAARRLRSRSTEECRDRPGGSLGSHPLQPHPHLQPDHPHADELDASGRPAGRGTDDAGLLAGSGAHAGEGRVRRRVLRGCHVGTRRFRRRCDGRHLDGRQLPAPGPAAADPDHGGRDQPSRLRHDAIHRRHAALSRRAAPRHARQPDRRPRRLECRDQPHTRRFSRARHRPARS